MKRKMFLDKQKQINNLERAQQETEQIERHYVTDEEVEKLCTGLTEEKQSILKAFAYLLNLEATKEQQIK